jgi:hypothetical protein
MLSKTALLALPMVEYIERKCRRRGGGEVEEAHR